MLGLDLLAAIAAVPTFNFVSKCVSLFTHPKKEKNKKGKKKKKEGEKIEKEIMPLE